uniref:Uncharacterized protein n=1 Tax=Anguilla anguilla TaxID=7936 RepID=A0A0E9TXS7_ANGAN
MKLSYQLSSISNFLFFQA